ncbi:MAG: ferredoxin family protein [Leptolinea sp.]|nr:ferredoxin family protein [Leptolinea sp.]
MQAPVYLGVNTLVYDSDACVNCGMCSMVCPHGVFESGETNARLVRPENCMEYGACMQYCPGEAIYVNSGVSCTTAMIMAALQGKKEVTCGGDSSSGSSGCCG